MFYEVGKVNFYRSNNLAWPDRIELRYKLRFVSGSSSANNGTENYDAQAFPDQLLRRERQFPSAASAEACPRVTCPPSGRS